MLAIIMIIAAMFVIIMIIADMFVILKIIAAYTRSPHAALAASPVPLKEQTAAQQCIGSWGLWHTICGLRFKIGGWRFQTCRVERAWARICSKCYSLPCIDASVTVCHVLMQVLQFAMY
jgi:hypothetical protein